MEPLSTSVASLPGARTGTGWISAILLKMVTPPGAKSRGESPRCQAVRAHGRQCFACETNNAHAHSHTRAGVDPCWPSTVDDSTATATATAAAADTADTADTDTTADTDPPPTQCLCGAHPSTKTLTLS